MKYLKIGFDLFLKNIILSLLLILQLSAAIGLINVMLATVNAQTLKSNLFEPLSREKGAYVMPSAEFHRNSSQDYQPRYLSSLKKLKNNGQINQYTFTTEKTEFIEGYAYDNYLLERFSFPLSKGKGFKEAKDNVIPIIINKETPELQYGTTIESSIIDRSGALIPIHLQIIGVLDESQFYISFSTGGTNLGYNDIIKKYDTKTYDTPLAIMRQNDLAKYKSYSFGKNSCNMIFFDSDISDADYKANLELLSRDGIVQPLDEMYRAGQLETKETLRSMLPMLLCVFSISLIGIISFHILHTLNQMKTFAIFYICGSRWKNCLFICCGFLFWILLFTTMLLGGAYTFVSMEQFLKELGPHFAWNNLWATLGTCLLCFVSAILPPYILLKNTSPIELFHNQE